MPAPEAPARPARRAPRPRPPRRGREATIDLALQGGGSHGAFTWGVLDRLLEDESLGVDGVSGTSAGALNAAVLATGWAEGGRAGARAALAAFWHDVATPAGSACFGGAAGASSLAPPGLAAYNLDWNPFYVISQQWLKLFSPYQFNPLGKDPLRAIVQRHVRPAALREGPLSVFVTATSVRTGQPRVFGREALGSDIGLDALLASACLPQLFRAVQIEGEAYWDGGYSGNPALWPLIYETPTLDVLLVKINPLLREGVPDTPAEIADRVNEITFNAGLVGELRAIGFVQRLVAEGRLEPGRYKGLRLHMVADDEGLAPLHPSSKLNTERSFLEALHRLGRAAAERWLTAHRRDVGQRSTLDLSTFLAPRRG
ncbi:patatin-like phospholipase family protein [Rubrivivax rivuli]|uniref:Patatin-like phospholipase family protein n=1 Tax=Rubrivivax rivuli TaxID=1862385 RepID=A0A437RC43_9BURK|nr:patatin-like phospholipase family protein [Rubrivivax rivuli]RVU44361.1 patatin-like phospholipase family protein [Rubrivivax rivuli]